MKRKIILRSLGYLVGIFLIAASLSKIMDPSLFFFAIKLDQYMPALYIYLVVCSLELVLGISLFTGTNIKFVSTISALLFLSFIVFNFFNLSQEDDSCGCFSNNLAESAPLFFGVEYHIVRNLFLVAMSGCISILVTK